MFEFEKDAWDIDRNCQIHRTLVEFLIQERHPEVAAALVHGSVEVTYSCKVGKADLVNVEIPPEGYPLVAGSDEIQQVIRRAVREVTAGNFNLEPAVELRMKLLPVPSDGWEAEMKHRISNFRGSNQGLISELCAARNGRPPHTWNELRYASSSEIRIAQELERRKVLFFPLAVAVRAETGESWRDHREVDFLVCNNGTWGILEVSYHPDRFERDAEKDVWFKQSGILCIQHCSAERCYRDSEGVISEFLSILKQFEK